MSELAPEPFALPPLPNAGRKHRPAVGLFLAGVLAAVVGALVVAHFQRGTRVAAGGGLGSGAVVIETNLGYQDAAAAGTGIVLTSQGEILTNNHVVHGATTIKVVVPGTGAATRRPSSATTSPHDIAVVPGAGRKRPEDGAARRLRRRRRLGP